MATRKGSSNKATPTARDLEKALETLRALGFKVEPPTSEAEAEKQEASVAKLGFSDAKAKKLAKLKAEQEERDSRTFLKARLGAQHYVGGNTYGPGEISIPKKQEALFRSLIYQDNLCRQAHSDTAQLNPVSRCYLIKQGNGRDQYNKYQKQEVSEAAFNSERIWEEVAVTSGSFDIAGFNPNFGQENRSF